MNNNIYKHSFARRLTRWIMVVLFIMMGSLAYLVYEVMKTLAVDGCANTIHVSMLSTAKSINCAMTDVSVAVKNNIFDIERNLNQPNQLQDIMERIVTQNPRVRSCGISFIENYYPQKGRSFCPYAWRNDSSQVEKRLMFDDGKSYLDAEWFKEAVAADSAYWSKPFLDTHDDKTPLAAYMYPIHDQKGRVVAILGADLSLDFLTKLLEEQNKNFQNETWSMTLSGAGFYDFFVLLRDGTYITHPEQKRILKGNYFVHIKDADEPGVAEKTIKKMSKGMKSYNEYSRVVSVNRNKSYLFYMPLEDTDWILVVSVWMIALNFIGVIFGVIMLMIMAFVLLVTFFVCRLAIRRAAKPLKQLAANIDKMADGHFDTVLPAINSHDEIHLLRDSFENMQHSLTTYMDELKKTTAEKASIESELKIAHDIQMAMLPKTYPAFPDRHDLDIYGMVMPAKAVGGDLYDFFIRDDKLFFCIGDVSGKGVPASLVMAVTRSLFRNIAAYTDNPGHVLIALNDALGSNNESIMFVTLFLGILDLTSGQLSYSNAGHNQPLLLIDGEISVLSCDANLPLGVMPGMQFTIESLQLKEGDGIFLYTDGLNEAENIHQQEFGMDRMLQVAKTTLIGPQRIIETMTSAVHQFVGDAEQNDDLTMLAIQYTKS